MKAGERHSPETRALMRERRLANLADPADHLHRVHQTQTGPGHPNWKGGRASRVYRAIAFAAHGRRCCVCGTEGTTGNPLEVRHKDGDLGNSDPANLEVRCRKDNPKRGWKKGRTR